MSCNCIKIKNDKMSRVRSTVKLLADREKRPYIIYERDGELYFDCADAWEKEGRDGTIREIVYPV